MPAELAHLTLAQRMRGRGASFVASRTCRVAVLWSTCSQPIEQFSCSTAVRPAGVRYIFCYMTNRFRFELHPQDIRWAAAEGVSQDVIAAVLLLHERSVDEIAPQLSAVELEQVIVLVGRSPRLYARGTLEALENKRATPPAPPAEIVHPNAVAREKAAPTNHRREASAYAGAGKPWGHDAQPPFRTSPGAQRRPPEQIKRGEASGAPAELKTAPRPLTRLDRGGGQGLPRPERSRQSARQGMDAGTAYRRDGQRTEGNDQARRDRRALGRKTRMPSSSG
jgi:hypothetical protein